MKFILKKSSNANKKFMVQEIFEDGKTGRTIHFGAAGMSDYTIHHDHDRMLRYEQRHKGRENWTKSGILTAGFWSKWILWNQPSLSGSIRHTERKFGIKITRSSQKTSRSRSRSRSKSRSRR